MVAENIDEFGKKNQFNKFLPSKFYQIIYA